MRKINLNGILAAIIITFGIIIHGVIIKEDHSQVSTVMDINEVADYLSLTEDDVLTIIELENSYLNKNVTFYGAMLTYYIVDDEYYFYKDKVDQWVSDTSTDERNYDFDKMILRK